MTQIWKPENWKANPTSRREWDWALYPITDDKWVGREDLEELLERYEDVQVENSYGRLRVMVEE